MDTITYLGEHLWLGTIGHSLILLGFATALLSCYAYFQSVRQKEESWTRIGRISFFLHAASFLVVIVILFYAMINQMYEYIYVYRTVTDGQPMKFLLAAFWEDQEGSFMLWMFWHIVLGIYIILKKDRWEAPVIGTLALIEAFISSMLLGVYLPFVEGDVKIGSNPFSLIRDVFEGPIFANADYLSLVTGTGLNPLLQNYWMTIHPPVLFLGFASVSIPFCYAIGGLIAKEHKEMVSRVLPWALFSASVFGLGILMGGAWAYEALTFGGYWAWDPVENTSLVPWLVLVAGIHTNLIARNTGYAYRSTYIYYLLAFLLVLYSTFLTRSGILGDTSVHAFTTMGLEAQLILFIGGMLGLALFSYLKSLRSIPRMETEESVKSREFWMFIGALVLLFSGLLMSISTSLPVYNKIVELFNPNYIGKVITDQMEHHNRFQIWIGVFMGLLAGLSVLLRYKALNWEIFRGRFVRDLALSGGIALALLALLQSQLKIFHWSHYFFLYAAVFVIVSNLHYLLFGLKKNLRMAGSVFAHTGFGVLLLGIMFSGLNKKNISSNPFAQAQFVEEESLSRALVLIKGEPFFSQDYWINYVGDTLIGKQRNYELQFRKVNKENEVLDEFIAYPSALYSNDFTKIEALNPGNERKLKYDVFVAAAPPQHLQDIEIARSIEDSLKYLIYQAGEGDHFETDNYSIDIGRIRLDKEYRPTDHGNDRAYDLSFSLPMKIVSKTSGKEYQISPGLGVQESLIFQFPEVIDELGIKVKVPETEFAKVYREDSELDYREFSLKEGEEKEMEGYRIRLTGFNRNPESSNYLAEEGDIALGARLALQNESGELLEAQPLFILRGNQQFSVKDFLVEQGIHLRFTKIDPLTETMSFQIAVEDRQMKNIQFMVAEDVPRSDILIVEANIFPGINMVWAGCLLMLGGLFLSLLAKRKRQAGSDGY